MRKPSNLQLTVLSKAAERQDGAADVPEGVKGATAARLAASLVAQKLMREIRSKAGTPVWRKDENGRGISLVLLRAGRAALGSNTIRVGDPEPTKPQQAVKKPKDRIPGLGTAEIAVKGMIPLPRSGSKQALVIGMLSEQNGSTLGALIAATGWLPHTVRAALTGLRKRGLAIERVHDDKLGSVYRIASRKAA